MRKYGIGQAVSRFEDPRLVRGGGRYVDDMVLPGMAFGHVLRSPHAHARIRAIDAGKAKAAPGVLAVLTGADWEASGWGDLPVPGGMKRRDGGPMYRPRYPALVRDRVRWVGDYVAFVVAETYLQAVDAAELIEVDYEPLPGHGLDRRGGGAGRAAGVGRLPGQHLLRSSGRRQGRDRRRLRRRRPCRARAFRHQSRHRGDDGAARQRSAITTAPTAATPSTPRCSARHPFRAELAQDVLKVPESHIRVVAGDIGGSFGMKSAVYNEVALVLLAVEDHRPAGEVDQHALRGLSERRPGARQCHRRRAGARRPTARFSACGSRRSPPSAPICRPAMPAFVGNLGTLAGVYRTPAIHVDVTAVFTHTNPMRPYRGNGRPEAAYVIERMVDLAADRTGHRPRRAAPAQHHSRRRDAVQDRPHLHLRLRRIRQEHGDGAAARRRRRLSGAARGIAQARQAARARHFQHHRARRRAELSKAPRSGSIAAAP